MHTDPLINYTPALRLREDRIHDADRERDAALCHAWDEPLVDLVARARVSVGGLIVRLGQAIEGATSTVRPATAHR